MGQETTGFKARERVYRDRCTRYRLSEQLSIYRNDGSFCQAMTCEISVGGLSATTPVVLRPGEDVRLSPIVGEQVSAIVRRKVGKVYGFEFTAVPRKVREEIDFLCRRLVPFQGLPGGLSSRA
jgi:hypothetical protein